MTPDVRRYWVEELKLLEPGPDFKEYDAVETAMAQAISVGSTSHRARVAFKALQGEFRRAVMAGTVDIRVLVPKNGVGFGWATSAREAAEIATKVRGPLYLVSLKAAIEAAKSEYATLVALSGVRSTAPVAKLKLGGR